MTTLNREHILQALAENGHMLRAAKLQRYATPPYLPAPEQEPGGWIPVAGSDV